MGAFETFVNANLGIRKPLILDLGHPTGSSKAAGIVGSEYIDTETNNIYEKTGENNLEDWVLTRKLGDSLIASESGILSRVEVIQNSSSSQSFSASINIPQNTSDLNISYSSLGNSITYLSSPKIFASIRFNSAPEAIYAHSIYGVDTERFNIQFSDEIQQPDCFLDILIAASADQVSGDISSENSVSESTLWFEESGDSLMLRESSLLTSEPAVELWEEGPNNTLMPLESSQETTGVNVVYFEETGQYLTIT
jgi:hypothetical protein